MNEAAERSDRSFAIMLNQRTNSVKGEKLHEMIQSGELGQLRRVNWIITDWYRNQSYYDAAGWKANRGRRRWRRAVEPVSAPAGSAAMAVRHACEGESLRHEGKWHDIEVEADDVTAYMELNGATGVFVTTDGRCSRNQPAGADLRDGKICKVKADYFLINCPPM